MMTAHTPLPTPFPIRSMDTGWEVLLIDESDVKHCIRCDSEQDAVALSNARSFNAAFERRVRCNIVDVEQSVEMLRRYDLQHCKLYRRLSYLAEDLRAGVI